MERLRRPTLFPRKANPGRLYFAYRRENTDFLKKETERKAQEQKKQLETWRGNERIRTVVTWGSLATALVTAAALNQHDSSHPLVFMLDHVAKQLPTIEISPKAQHFLSLTLPGAAAAEGIGVALSDMVRFYLGKTSYSQDVYK